MATVEIKKRGTYQKYASFFRLRFVMGLQYRAAALAGVVTQFMWGFMEIKVFLAFEQSNPAAFPMTFGQLAAYEWLQQAFLAFFMAWMMEPEIFDCITDGNVSYELCRPVDLYNMWFARSMATRLSRGLLRCFPILIVAALLPEPYRLIPPSSPTAAVWCVITMLLGLAVTVALCMIIYMLTFFTVSSLGLRLVFFCMVEFLEGAVIPLPFFPQSLRNIMERLPFASMQNVPLLIYSGSMSGTAIWQAAGWQFFWLVALILIGKIIGRHAIKKTTVQGG